MQTWSVDCIIYRTVLIEAWSVDCIIYRTVVIEAWSVDCIIYRTVVIETWSVECILSEALYFVCFFNCIREIESEWLELSNCCSYRYIL